jgi:hypothetical protein
MSEPVASAAQESNLMYSLATLSQLNLNPNMITNTFDCASCDGIRNAVPFHDYLMTGRVVCLACIAKYQFTQRERELEFFDPSLGTPHESVSG